MFQSKQLSPARSVSTSGHTDHSITNARTYFQHHATSTSTANGRMITSAPSTTTTTSIPLPSNSSTSSNSSIGSTSNGLKYVGKLPVSQASSQSHNKLTQPVTFTARRDAEKSASADAHINQLRMVRLFFFSWTKSSWKWDTREVYANLGNQVYTRGCYEVFYAYRTLPNCHSLTSMWKNGRKN